MNEILLSEFTKIGCTNRKDAAITLQVYKELTEVKKYWDVEYKYNSEIKCLYITARKTKSSDEILFVPVSVSVNFCFKSMQRYLRLNKEAEKKSVCLAICTTDSTCVYYKIENGMADPPPRSAAKSREGVHKKLDAALYCHQKLLEDAAMYNLPVTLPKDIATQMDEESK